MNEVDVKWVPVHSELRKILQEEVILTFLRSLKTPINIGSAYNTWINKNPRTMGYKTFQRWIAELTEREIIEIKKNIGGVGGNTTTILKIN